MSAFHSFTTGLGQGKRQNRKAPVVEVDGLTQPAPDALPVYPFQPLPPPNGPAPYRFDLSQLLTPADIAAIEKAGSMVFHSVGDTGDYRGRQQDFVASMMTLDAEALPATKKPAFFYHLGDVVYFAGGIDKYGDNFYETYKDYPGFIVAIPGNHDCQPDDPEDGPVDPTKTPLDGWVKNFMSTTPEQLGSYKTGAGRTQMDLPNVYWTFTTPFATILGLFSNVGEDQGEIHADQVAWFEGELRAADPHKALIVAVHHPPFSGDTDHGSSTVVEGVLTTSFAAAGRTPDLVLSGHVHNYQRFTQKTGKHELTCVVAGNGGYTNLGKLAKIKGAYPTAPSVLGNGITLEQYDQENFGFLRLEVSKTSILVTCFTAPYSLTGAPASKAIDTFEITLKTHKVKTLPNAE